MEVINFQFPFESLRSVGLALFASAMAASSGPARPTITAHRRCVYGWGRGGAGGGACRIIAGQEGHKIIIPVAASVSAPTKTTSWEEERRRGRPTVL